MKRPQFKAVLAWVNKIRKKSGKRPLKQLPKGYRKDGYSCPLARATGLPMTMYVKGSVPGRFIADFDDGKYPWLEQK